MFMKTSQTTFMHPAMDGRSMDRNPLTSAPVRKYRQHQQSQGQSFRDLLAANL